MAEPIRICLLVMTEVQSRYGYGHPSELQTVVHDQPSITLSPDDKGVVKLTAQQCRTLAALLTGLAKSTDQAA